jgi:hypothetical protein
MRASDAAQRRRLLSSSRGAIDFQRFRRVLMAEAVITRRFYRRRSYSGNPPSYKILQSVIKMTQLFLNGPLQTSTGQRQWPQPVKTRLPRPCR